MEGKREGKRIGQRGRARGGELINTPKEPWVVQRDDSPLRSFAELGTICEEELHSLSHPNSSRWYPLGLAGETWTRYSNASTLLISQCRSSGDYCVQRVMW